MLPLQISSFGEAMLARMLRIPTASWYQIQHFHLRNWMQLPALSGDELLVEVTHFIVGEIPPSILGQGVSRSPDVILLTLQVQEHIVGSISEPVQNSNEVNVRGVERFEIPFYANCV